MAIGAAMRGFGIVAAITVPITACPVAVIFLLSMKGEFVVNVLDKVITTKRE